MAKLFTFRWQFTGGDANNRTSSRFYNGNTLTIAPNSDYTITSIVFTATSTNYAGVLGNSTWTNATASVNGTEVTVTPTNGANAVSASVGGTCGFTSIVINYVYTGVVVTKYDITIDSSIANGSVSADVNKAAEGETVRLTATPASGYALDAWNVYKTGESGTKVTVTSNSFTMPAYPVTVSASFAAVPTITMNTTSITDVAAAGVSATATSAYNLVNGASNSDVTITCDGTVVTAASKNATAGSIDYTVAPNTGAARDGLITVKYGSEAAHEITVSQLAATYVLTLNATNGTVSATVGGSPVSSGASIAVGAEVTLDNTPNEGYAFDSYDVYKTSDSSTKVNVSSSKFIMPDYAVTAIAAFEETSSTSIAHLDESGMRNTINLSAHAYADTESQYSYDGATWLIRGNANQSGYWVQIRNNATVSYIGITAPGAISKVTVKISNATNSSGGQYDISKHGAFNGTVALTTSDSGGYDSNQVGSTTTITNNIAEITPSGSNSTLYIKTSGAARIWDVVVTYAN